MSLTQMTQRCSEFINQFFFPREVPFGMAIARIVVPLVCFGDMFPRWFWCRELYSSDGAPASLADNFGFPGFPPELPGDVTVFLFSVMMFLFITSAIGLFSRFSLLVSFSLYSYLTLLDCMSTLTKYTVISSHLLLILGLSACGEIWSVDRWLKNRRGKCRPAGLLAYEELRFPIWPQRLLQILLVVIYFGAAITKLHTPAFFNGDQLHFWMITHLGGEFPIGDIMSQSQLLLVSSAYLTAVWEITFMFSVQIKWLKWPSLALGATFHFMTLLTLGLFVFPLVMISAYLSFLTEREFIGLQSAVKGMLRKRGWMSRRAASPAWIQAPAEEARSTWPLRLKLGGVFGVVIALVGVAGVEADYWRDPYKIRRPEGPLPLVEIPKDEARRLLTDDVEIRPQDYIHAFDLGTTTIGEHLLFRSAEFRQGERIIAQVTMNPPHGDMWLDCVLLSLPKAKPTSQTPVVTTVAQTVVAEKSDIEADDTEELPTPADNIKALRKGERQISRVGQVVCREQSRVHFNYMLNCAIEPGDYAVSLQYQGKELCRQSFTLVPGPNSRTCAVSLEEE